MAAATRRQGLVGGDGAPWSPGGGRREPMTALEVADVLRWRDRFGGGWQAAADYCGRPVDEVRRACEAVAKSASVVVSRPVVSPSPVSAPPPPAPTAPLVVSRAERSAEAARVKASAKAARIEAMTAKRVAREAERSKRRAAREAQAAERAAKAAAPKRQSKQSQGPLNEARALQLLAEGPMGQSALIRAVGFVHSPAGHGMVERLLTKGLIVRRRLSPRPRHGGMYELRLADGEGGQ